MGGRVVEGTGLENRQARKGLVGSNPTPSASYLFATLLLQFFYRQNGCHFAMAAAKFRAFASLNHARVCTNKRLCRKPI